MMESERLTPLGPPMYKQLVRSTGDKLGLHLASEVESGWWEGVGSFV